jgi:hypothetical protein
MFTIKKIFFKKYVGAWVVDPKTQVSLYILLRD